MIELFIPTTLGHWPSVEGAKLEECRVLLARNAQSGERHRLLAKEMIVPHAQDYLKRTAIAAELRPEFIAAVTKRAANGQYSVCFIHTHPAGGPASFSSIDDYGERALAEFFSRRLPNAVHVSMVLSESGVSARVVGSDQFVSVIRIGKYRELLTPSNRRLVIDHQFDRQVRAFGESGQAAISKLSIAIVGLGGTGSIVAQQLVHLGVRRFLLIDPDTVDQTNLNRLSAVTAADLGRAKVEVAGRYISQFAPDSQIETLQEDVVRARIARPLGDVDFIFGCTDSHGSRAVLQQVAYQYLVPCIDMGSTIVSQSGRITHVQGRIQMLSAGLPCLTCTNLLDPNLVRRDMMSTEELLTDPYIVGEQVPAPSVMSINGTVASLAITMFIDAVTKFGASARHVVYNALQSSLREVAYRADPRCFICSDVGVVAQGDFAPLMARQD